jgi:zinc-binding alcohol dehydrogenase/oxidoreductase
MLKGSGARAPELLLLIIIAMRALVFKGKNLPFVVHDMPKPKPTANQVLIKITHAALNHRDIWVLTETENTYPEGIILGSDGGGVIESIGAQVDEKMYPLGQEVVINPSLAWGTNPVVPSDKFQILGFPSHGTFAEYIAIDKEYVFPKPGHVSMSDAVAMPLSGLTAYRALFTKARLRANEKVLITGIGGGAALWVLTFAVAYQANVYVTSSSHQKIEQAKQLGAKGGYLYTDAQWSEDAAKEVQGFDVIVDCAGGDQFNKYIELAVPGGRIVNFGRTAGNITDISTRLLYWKQLSIYGTAMGTRDEFMSMLAFVESRKLKPVIDAVYPLEQHSEAFKRMLEAKQFGKIVLQIQ